MRLISNILLVVLMLAAGCVGGGSDSQRQSMETVPRRQLSGGSNADAGGNVVAEAKKPPGDEPEHLGNALRDQFTGRDIADIRRDGDVVTVTFKSDVIFDPNSTAMKPGSYQEIKRLAEVLLVYPKTLITISAHTDGDGPEVANQEISQRRAEIVRNTLLTQGLPVARLTAQGFGESQPLADNRTLAGKHQNRRIVITILPADKNASPQETLVSSWNRSDGSTAEMLISNDRILKGYNDHLEMLYRVHKKNFPHEPSIEQWHERWLSKRNACKDKPCIEKAYLESFIELNQIAGEIKRKELSL